MYDKLPLKFAHRNVTGYLHSRIGCNPCLAIKCSWCHPPPKSNFSTHLRKLYHEPIAGISCNFKSPWFSTLHVRTYSDLGSYFLVSIGYIFFSQLWLNCIWIHAISQLWLNHIWIQETHDYDWITSKFMQEDKHGRSEFPNCATSCGCYTCCSDSSFVDEHYFPKNAADSACLLPLFPEELMCHRFSSFGLPMYRSLHFCLNLEVLARLSSLRFQQFCNSLQN